MREHLYKAKRVNWRELPKEEWWVYGMPVKRGSCLWMYTGEINIIELERDIYGNPYSDAVKYEVDPETVCEYTGLTDKNGREIFEMDIVSYMDTYSTDNGYAESDCIGKVFWCEEELCFYVTERLSAESWEVLEDCCVIGNIFDNPELLEGGEAE